MHPCPNLKNNNYTEYYIQTSCIFGCELIFGTVLSVIWITAAGSGLILYITIPHYWLGLRAQASHLFL